MLSAIADLAVPESRANAARELARQAGANDLIIFIRDPDSGESLPAPGFPQKLRNGRAWQALITRAISEGSADAELDGKRIHAVGFPDGTALAFLGGDPHDIEFLLQALPLAAALFRMECATTRALAVAEKSTRARDEFLATVSHELRTPLTSVIGWVQLLRNDPEGTMLAEGLETIDRNARAQSRLIEDILDFSRINAGKMRLSVRPTDLIDVINSAIDVVRPAADAKGVKLDSVLDPSAGFVSGDHDRLQQIVWNLLSNAVKFTPRGGRVQVRLERVNSHAEICVSDTGEGISADFLPYVFDRFSQADTTLARKQSGLGLGLGIVRHLVELHGGTVQAFSKGKGKGASFAVRLPIIIAYQPQIEMTPQQSRDGLADLSGVSVLLVEDNDDARMLLTTILTRSSAIVSAAENVPAAMRILETTRPDLVVSDIEMPGEDGYSFIRRLRQKDSPLNRVPAIALTAYTRGVDRVRALAAGFQMHLGKPIDPAELVAAIKSLVTTSARG